MRSDPTAREVPLPLPNGCMAAFALGDDESVAAMDGEWIALMRDRARRLLSQGLYHLGARKLRVGTLARAEAFFSEDDEIQALRRQKGSGVVGKLIVTAWRGREEEARATAAELVSEHDGYGRGWNLSQIDHAMSVLELSLGNYHAAALLNPDGTLPTLGNDLALAPLRAADAVEAHVRGGDRRVADAVVDWLSERATANQSALELGLLARCRALLAADDEAEGLYQEAVERLRSSEATLHLAEHSSSSANGCVTEAAAGSPGAGPRFHRHL